MTDERRSLELAPANAPTLEGCSVWPRYRRRLASRGGQLCKFEGDASALAASRRRDRDGRGFPLVRVIGEVPGLREIRRRLGTHESLPAVMVPVVGATPAVPSL